MKYKEQQMHGIVNFGIQKMVKENFGDETWTRILEKSQVGDGVFELATPYPDGVTVQLAVAASEVLNLPLEGVLKTYGKWWIQWAASDYPVIFNKAGADFFEFISNLNTHHGRVGYMMPQLAPPAFQVLNAGTQGFQLKYTSQRDRLDPFVVGLLEGLGDHFNTPVTVTAPAHGDQGSGIFEVAYA